MCYLVTMTDKVTLNVIADSDPLLPIELQECIDSGAKKLPTDKYHISYSEMVDWSDCSYRHKLKHINKIGMDGPTEHTEFGGVVHDAIEQYLLGNAPLDADLTGKKVIETLTALPNFKGNAQEWADAVKPIFDELPDFLKNSFPNYSVVSAEFQLMEQLEKKKTRFFKGFIDGIFQTEKINLRKKDPTPETIYYIVDWKTTSWGWSIDKKRDPKKQMQLVLYKYFWCRKNNIPLEQVKCAWVLLKRTAKPGAHIELVPVSVGEKSIEKALSTVYSMLNSIEKGIYTKNRNSCKFCPYSNTENCV